LTDTSIPNNWIDSPTRVAADLYQNERHNLTFDAVSSRSGVELEHLRSVYSLKADLLRGYYTDAWHRYVEMESYVPDFTHYTLAEKLTTLVFSLCDEFEIVEGFAAETYGPLIYDAALKSQLASNVRDKIAQYVANDDATSMLVMYIPGNSVTYILTWVTLQLINERVNDSSTDKERTSALTDKVTTLIQSAVYTGTTDHLIDLARYLGVTYYSNK
jgi:hypothetical protein